MSDLRGLSPYFRRLVTLVGSAREAALSRYATGFAADVAASFDRSRDPATGRSWPPLSYRTGRPLVRTGRLRAAAVTSASAPRQTVRGLVFIYRGPGYGIVHIRGSRTVPRRNFWGASPDTVAAAAEAAAGAAAADAARAKP